VEHLAQPQAQSHPSSTETLSETQDDAARSDRSDRLSPPARALLKFSTPRDPAQLATFIDLRVLNPEHSHWRRGIEAALIYHRLHDDLRVPFTYRVPDAREAQAQQWPATLATFPLGQWIADARRSHARGDMAAERVEQLEKLGMVWSHFDVAWHEGLDAARGWAKENGHLLAPLDATFHGYKVGIWLKNARAAARRQPETQQRDATNPPPKSAPAELSQERRDQLDDIDPSWCPPGRVEWQRAFHLTRHHLEAGGTLPTEPGTVLRQGEDLGRWVRTQTLRFDELTGVQQWMCQHVLGIHPAGDNEKPAPRRSHNDRWALNYTAAKQYYQREGHLRVPRKHIETITVDRDDGESHEQQDVALKLGAWIGNQHTRAATLPPQRIQQLTQIGMPWT
jgi:hypothetical protein